MGGRQVRRALAVLALSGGIYALTLLQAPQSVPVAAERLSQTVTLQALSGAAVEMDRCATAREARISAAEWVGRGSAGYVHRDDAYLVLGILLEDAGEADRMCAQLNAAGMSVARYDCVGQSLTLNVTGEREHIDALLAAVHAVDMAALQPGRIAQQLDNGQIDGNQARGLIAMLVSDLQTAQSGFRAAEAQGSMSDALDGLMAQSIDALEPLTKDGICSALQLSGQARCAGMAVWFARENMIRTLSGQ